MKQTKILLVDDEIDIQDILSDALKIHGFDNIKTIGNGAKALELLEQEDFDLIISDFLMPEINGLELFQRSKKLLPRSPKFLMLTGMNSLELDQQEMEVMHKPFPIRDLIEKVQLITA